jgi:S-formylglutathione hydrolase FrmB
MGRLVLLAVAVAMACSATPAWAGTVTTIEIPARAGELTAGAYKYDGPPKANVLLPDGYDPAREYPLVVLLHGLNAGYNSWVKFGRIAEVYGRLDAIVVMPEGAGGWFVDWRTSGRRWESYILDQVIPQVHERYKIRPERRWHAIAGVSMGGFGATYLAGRAPGYFGTLVSTSGFVDPEVIPMGPRVMAGMSGAGVDGVFGPPDGPYARGHMPRRLVANLQHTRVYMGVGDGTVSERGVSPGNEGAATVANMAAEVLIRQMNDRYAATARSAGLDFTYAPHAGVHDAPDNRFDLANAVTWGMFEPVAENPESWVNDTVADHGELWGVRYRLDPAPQGIVRFRRSGNELAMSGAATTATLTFPGGCGATVALPATVAIPACDEPRTLAARATPRTLTRGRRARLAVRVTPAVPGALVRLGKYRVRTDARGRATIRGCLKTSGTRSLVVSAPGYRRASVRIRVRASSHRCPG